MNYFDRPFFWKHKTLWGITNSSSNSHIILQTLAAILSGCCLYWLPFDEDGLWFNCREWYLMAKGWSCLDFLSCCSSMCWLMCKGLSLLPVFHNESADLQWWSCFWLEPESFDTNFQQVSNLADLCPLVLPAGHTCESRLCIKFGSRYF